MAEFAFAPLTPASFLDRAAAVFAVTHLYGLTGDLNRPCRYLGLTGIMAVRDLEGGS